MHVAPDDPRRADIVALLEQHLAFAAAHSPAADRHALDLDGLTRPGIAFFSARAADGTLLGVAALKRLPGAHVEIKSMHTAATARRSGVGRALLAHLLMEARRRGAQRVSLETGSMAAFAPARALYASAGFRPCAPFAGYRASANSTYMTLRLTASAGS